MRPITGIVAVVVTAVATSSCSSDEDEILRKADLLCRIDRMEYADPVVFLYGEHPRDYIVQEEVEAARNRINTQRAPQLADERLKLFRLMAGKAYLRATCELEVQLSDGTATVKATRTGIDVPDTYAFVDDPKSLPPVDLVAIKSGLEDANPSGPEFESVTTTGMMRFVKREAGWRATFADAADVASQ